MAKSGHSLTDPRHLMRWMKHQAGGADDEALRRIAAEERVALATVKQSVLQVDTYRKRNTGLELDLAMRDLVISSVPQVKATLDGLLGAMELVEHKNPKTGKIKVVKIADKVTRLEAIRAFTTLSASLQPKQPAVEVNVSQMNQTANISGAETNEERIARLRKKAQEHNMLPAEVAAVPEYIDAGGDADDEEEDDDEEDDDE